MEKKRKENKEIKEVRGFVPFTLSRVYRDVYINNQLIPPKETFFSFSLEFAPSIEEVELVSIFFFLENFLQQAGLFSLVLFT